MSLFKHSISSGQMYVVDPDILCKCGKPATEWLEIHAVHFCTEDVRTISSFLCDDCLAVDIGKAEVIATSGVVKCRSCGLEVVSLSDILVRHCSIEVR